MSISDSTPPSVQKFLSYWPVIMSCVTVAAGYGVLWYQVEDLKASYVKGVLALEKQADELGKIQVHIATLETQMGAIQASYATTVGRQDGRDELMTSLRLANQALTIEVQHLQQLQTGPNKR